MVLSLSPAVLQLHFPGSNLALGKSLIWSSFTSLQYSSTLIGRPSSSGKRIINRLCIRETWCVTQLLIVAYSKIQPWKYFHQYEKHYRYSQSPSLTGISLQESRVSHFSNFDKCLQVSSMQHVHITDWIAMKNTYMFPFRCKAVTNTTSSNSDQIYLKYAYTHWQDIFDSVQKQ